MYALSNRSISTAAPKPVAIPKTSPIPASVSVILAFSIRAGNSFINASATWTGEGSINPSTRPRDTESCHRIRMARMAETDHSLLVMLGDFLFNGKHISFGVVRNLNVCSH